jgi:hypothetical protein
VGRSESRSRWPGTISDAYACRSNDHVRRVWSTFPSARSYNPSQSGYVPLKRRYCIKGAHPPNVYVRDDGVLGTPEALLRYKSSGRDVFEAVRVHGVNTIPHRNVISHVARTGPISTMLVNSLRDHRKLSWGERIRSRLRRDDRLRMGSRPRV